MSTIPEEYVSNFDFGFTAVSDPDAVNPPPPPQVNTEEISGPILERINSLERNVGEVLNILERLEQVNTPTLDTDEYKELIEKDVREKLKKVEAMVMPLLTNLLKDADTKEFIKWPNRRQVIESFIDKFLAITRS
jgi:tetrahydromethanopterin S-methyltransferase subunit B